MRASLAFLAAGAVAFGLSAVFTKLCAFGPEIMVPGRMLLAGLALTPLVVRAWAKRPQARYLAAVALPGLLLAAHFELWIAGIKTTTAAAGTFLYAVNPVLLAAAERLLYRRKLPRLTLPCLLAILAGGVWLFLSERGSVATIGNLLCLGATVVFVAYLLVSARVAPRVPSELYLPLVYLWGGLLTLPVALLSGSLGSAPWSDPWAWLWLLAVALVPTLVGHGSLMVGVRHHTPLVVSFFTLFEPAGATLFAALLLAEYPSPAQVPSYILFLISTTVFLWLRFGSRDRAGSPRAPHPPDP